jgi:hypothetical protein
MKWLGADPGAKGAIAVIGEGVNIYPMPSLDADGRGIDLGRLFSLVRSFGRCPVAIESNTARPKESADFAMRFGVRTGQLQAMLFASGCDITMVSPMKWMNAFGLRAKEYDPGCVMRDDVASRLFPEAKHLWKGPRGGILDGHVEAVLIAEWLRRESCHKSG